MKKKVENPYAFAFRYQADVQTGMTLRDYFAATALQGFCADGNVGTSSANFDISAEECYILADAMLKARLNER